MQEGSQGEESIEDVVLYLEDVAVEFIKEKERCQESRRELSGLSRELRQMSDVDKLLHMMKVMKMYQMEVDNVTKRAQRAEYATLKVMEHMKKERQQQQQQQPIQQVITGSSSVDDEDVKIRALEDEMMRRVEEVEMRCSQLLQQRDEECGRRVDVLKMQLSVERDEWMKKEGEMRRERDAAERREREAKRERDRKEESKDMMTTSDTSIDNNDDDDGAMMMMMGKWREEREMRTQCEMRERNLHDTYVTVTQQLESLKRDNEQCMGKVKEMQDEMERERKKAQEEMQKLYLEKQDWELKVTQEKKKMQEMERKWKQEKEQQPPAPAPQQVVLVTSSNNGGGVVKRDRGDWIDFILRHRSVRLMLAVYVPLLHILLMVAMMWARTSCK